MRIITAALILSLAFTTSGHASNIDLSSPQRTYETCFRSLNLTTALKDAERKIKTCLTPTAQKALVSYAVLGAHFLDTMKNLKGQKLYPEILEKIDTTLEKHKLKNAARNDFKKANLPAVITEMLDIYSANDFILSHLTYTHRELKISTSSDTTAEGQDIFKLKKKLPVNRLELSFTKEDDNWLINYIAHK